MAAEGKRVLVTGVSRGLGLALAHILVEKGWEVLGVSRQPSEEWAALQKAFPGKTEFYPADLSQPDSLAETLFSREKGIRKPLHGLVNNAAGVYDDLVSNFQTAPMEELLRTNVLSPMVLVRETIRNMIRHRVAGSLVHISSISVHTGYKGLAMYAASKGALEAFSKNTAREWGGRGIRSNCVVAGFMETAMSASLSEDQKARIYQRTALKLPVSKESVAAMVEHLLSEASESVTGQNIFVDSGTL